MLAHSHIKWEGGGGAHFRALDERILMVGTFFVKATQVGFNLKLCLCNSFHLNCNPMELNVELCYSNPTGMTKDIPEQCSVSIKDATVLLNLGDSVTTDHISPAGSIARNSSAAR